MDNQQTPNTPNTTQPKTKTWLILVSIALVIALTVAIVLGVMLSKKDDPIPPDGKLPTKTPSASAKEITIESQDIDKFYRTNTKDFWLVGGKGGHRYSHYTDYLRAVDNGEIVDKKAVIPVTIKYRFYHPTFVEIGTYDVEITYEIPERPMPNEMIFGYGDLILEEPIYFDYDKIDPTVYAERLQEEGYYFFTSFSTITILQEP